MAYTGALQRNVYQCSQAEARELDEAKLQREEARQELDSFKPPKVSQAVAMLAAFGVITGVVAIFVTGYQFWWSIILVGGSGTLAIVIGTSWILVTTAIRRRKKEAVLQQQKDLEDTLLALASRELGHIIIDKDFESEAAVRVLTVSSNKEALVDYRNSQELVIFMTVEPPTEQGSPVPGR